MQEMDDEDITFRPTGEVSVPKVTNQLKFLKKGILSKKGMGLVIKPWVLRTVVLGHDGKLVYYDGNVLKGELQLHGATISYVDPSAADGRANAFQIANVFDIKKQQKATLLLAASSKPETDEWVTAITQVLSTTTGDVGNVLHGSTEVH